MRYCGTWRRYRLPCLQCDSRERDTQCAAHEKGEGLKTVAETLALLRYPEADRSQTHMDARSQRGAAS